MKKNIQNFKISLYFFLKFKIISICRLCSLFVCLFLLTTFESFVKAKLEFPNTPYDYGILKTIDSQRCKVEHDNLCK